ncbi:hypothetical protein OF83DRAFT_1099774 [Amylostereum chailletii]|nr:hypothetical protein OF83DRAFT_1099774 [Amylostereum chailletii]
MPHAHWGSVAFHLPFLLSLLSPVLAYPSAQHVLAETDRPTGTGSGTLRRYAVRSTGEAAEVLGLAQANDWDIWQATPSHVDVYFPAAQDFADATPGLPSPLPFRFSDHPIVQHAPNVQTTPSTPGLEWDLSSLANTTFHSAYHSLDELYAFINQFARQYPDKVKVVPLGHSGEGREMYALEISSRAKGHSGSHDSKVQGTDTSAAAAPLGFVISGAQHAREWVASAAAIYLAHALVANASEPYSLAPLLETFTFFIVPAPNPDGYVYTWEKDRFWYKDRLPLGHQAKCVGVDMNRNWGYKWKVHSKYLTAKHDAAVPEKSAVQKREEGNPCSHWYPGNRPFQAPEVNNMANYFERLPRLEAFLDLRSYGQMLSAPYSYSCKRSPKDAEDQLEAISGAAHMMKKSHGTSFTTGTLCSTLYRAPGNVVDWMYHQVGVKYSFAAHLRDTGTYGFALPEQWIRPVGEETAKMVEYLADFIAKKTKAKTRDGT